METDMLGATLLDPGPPPEAAPQVSPSTTAAPPAIPPTSGTLAAPPLAHGVPVAAGRVSPAGAVLASGAAQEAVSRVMAARPLLALVDTAPPRPPPSRRRRPSRTMWPCSTSSGPGPGCARCASTCA